MLYILVFLLILHDYIISFYYRRRPFFNISPLSSYLSSDLDMDDDNKRTDEKTTMMEDASFVLYLPISPNPPPRRGSSPPPTSPLLPKLSNLPDDCRVHLHGNDEDEAERGGDAYLAEDGHASEHAGHLGQVTCKVQHHHGHQRQPRRHGVEKQTPPPAEAAST